MELTLNKSIKGNIKYVLYSYKDCTIEFSNTKKFYIDVGVNFGCQSIELYSRRFCCSYDKLFNTFIAHDCMKNYNSFLKFIQNQLQYRDDSEEIAITFYKTIVELIVKEKGI